jgi:hypothetical protein
MLQAGRSRIRFPMKLLYFSTHPSSHAIALGLTQSLTEISTRNLFVVKGDRCVRLATSLIAYKMWEPQCLTNLWTYTTCYRDSFTAHLTHSCDPYASSSQSWLREKRLKKIYYGVVKNLHSIMWNKFTGYCRHIWIAFRRFVNGFPGRLTWLALSIFLIVQCCIDSGNTERIILIYCLQMLSFWE